MAKKKANKDLNTLGDALRALLMGRKASTQEDICAALEKLGYEITQSNYDGNSGDYCTNAAGKFN
jgi:hypothetical protein